jgi:outer membrane protein assembly factor BamB/ABC-type phosphate/phosphonate transport system substrate-binding protein
MRRHRIALAAAALAACLASGCTRMVASPRPISIVVMDPLALPLSCECVEGYAQRRYDKLAVYLQDRLRRPVVIAFSENLPDVVRLNGVRPDLVIGKQSVVLHDAAAIGVKVRPIARLTGQDGRTDFHGLFIVRASDKAKTIKDLAGYRVRFGPKDSDEKHAAALATLKTAHGSVPKKPAVSPGCSSAAVAVVENEADAAVISSYALPLLEGCDSIDKGTLRVVGRTGRVPFIVVAAAPSIGPRTERQLLAALLAVGDRADLLKALETKRGFVPAAGWADWRGPRRDGLTDDMPDALPAKPNVLWSRPMTGAGLAGVTIAGPFLITADKTRDEKSDVWRCVDASTGDPIWTLTYSAPDELAYSNAPRAQPVVEGDRVYLLGALGHLHCVRLGTGDVIWKIDLAKTFNGRMPQWGYASTPLIVGSKLIVGPGGEKASLVALNKLTGKVVWQTPGRKPAYASFIRATLGGRTQIIGYDQTTLGGWDPETGRRLWEIAPKHEDDFNVPTPIVVGDKLFVTTENNGSRLYAFGKDGTPTSKPVASSEGLAPDTSTPVVVDGKVFGCWGRKAYCLDARRGLKQLWSVKDDAFEDYGAVIGGNGRVLFIGLDGTLLLVRARGDKYEQISRLKLIGEDEEDEIWSHPALVGDRLYVRTLNRLICLDLAQPAR